MPTPYLFNLGLNQKKFCSTSKVSTAAVAIGCTRGRGSTTRMLNYCNKHSANPSLCINQFLTFSRNCEKVINISSIATFQSFNGYFVWLINPNTIINECQILNYSDPNTYIVVYGKFINNGIININNTAMFAIVDGNSTNNGTINVNNGSSLLNVNSFGGSPILNNNGTINVNNGSNLSNININNIVSSILNNNGKINLNNNSTLNNNDTTLNNNGIINNSGSTIDNTNGFTIGVINNSGNIYNGDNIHCTSGTIIGTITGNPALNECYNG